MHGAQKRVHNGCRNGWRCVTCGAERDPERK